MATKIFVTHFINPHLFWYFHIDAPRCNIIKAEVEKVENAILEECQSRKRYWKMCKQSIGPEIGDYIAVYFTSWERFIRARVDTILEFGSKPNEYIVWAMDHGFPFQTKIEYIHVLPKQCLAPINKIKRGGIANVLPGEKQFFGIELKTLRCRNWQQNACDQLQDLLFRSHKVVFDEQFCTNDDHFWGNLKFECGNGILVMAEEYLLEHNYAIRIINNFDKICINLNTIDQSPWINNSGNIKCQHNKFSTHNQKNSMLWKKHHVLDHTENVQKDYYCKVEEWVKRNQSIELDQENDQSDCESKDQSDFQSLYDPDEMAYIGMKLLSKNMMVEQKSFNKFVDEQTEIRKDIENVENIIGEKIHNISEDSILAIKTTFNCETFEVQKNTLPPIKSSQLNESVSSVANTSSVKTSSLSGSHSNNNAITTTQEKPISRADRLFQLKSLIPNLITMDKKNEEVKIVPKKDDYEDVENEEDNLPKMFDQKTNNENIVQQNNAKKPNSMRMMCTNFKILPGGFEERKDEIIETDLRKLIRSKTFEKKSYSKKNASTDRYIFVPTTKEAFEEFKPSDSSDEEFISLDNNDKNSTSSKFFDWMCDSKGSISNADDACDDNKNDIFMKNVCQKMQLWNKNKKISTPIIHEVMPKEKLRFLPEEPLLQNSIIDDLVLAHSRENLKTIHQIEDLKLNPKIYKQLIDEDIVKIYRMQAYAWAHLNMEHSLFLISGSRTGKTWSYIPQICHNVLEFIQYERYKMCENAINCDNDVNNEISTINGPIAIIIVPSTQHVDTVSYYCRQLLLNVRNEFQPYTPVVSCYGMSNLTSVKIELLNGCGILITTPASLYRLLDDTDNAPKLINYYRLRNIIIDDMDLMISRSEQVFTNVLKLLMKKNKANKSTISSATKKPQWIITSRHWEQIMPSMLKLVSQPVLLFGDFLEASVYGHVTLRIKLCTQEQKMEMVRDALVQHSMHEERSLIFCTTKNDVDIVVAGLTAAGHKCFVYDEERSTKSDLRMLLDWEKSILPGVVVCMDLAYCETNIQNVHNLIHFSMPNSWTKFTKRFRCIAKNLKNRLLDNFTKNSKSRDKENDNNNISSEATCTTSALILLDEENSEQLPRLLNFMKKHKQNGIIHADLEAACRRVMQEREEKRILNALPLCKFLLEFGNCDLPICSERHVLTRYDAINPSEGIPATGELKIHILKVNSPTHVTARLLAHKDAGETTWRYIRASKEVTIFGIQLNMHYSQKEHMLLFWPLELRKMCIYRKNHGYHRAMVIQMPPLKYPEIVLNIFVTIHLIDEGIELCNVESHDLFQCMPQFEDFPAQAVNIRLLNIVPYDNERTWNKHSTEMVRKWLKDDITNKEYVHVNVSQSLANTIWVKNIIVMEHLSTVNQYVHRRNLKKSLLENNFAIELDNGTGVSQLIEEFKLTNNMFENEEAHKNDEDEEEEKKDEQQQELQEVDNVVLDQEESKVVSEIIEHDHQDKTEVVGKMLNTCKKMNVDKWYELPLHGIMAVELDESNNGNWQDIFLQVYNDMNEFSELCQLINEHVIKLKQNIKNEAAEKKHFDLAWFKSNPNCIIRYKEDGYLRAKVFGVHGENTKKVIVRFFLCDYACFKSQKADNLFDDFFYETTDDIVNFMPYLGVHCRLTGIELTDLAAIELHKVKKKYLHAYAVSQRKEKPTWLQPLNINSYDILLYQSDEDMLNDNSEMLNKTLIDSGIAVPNAKTSHFLELDLCLSKVGVMENETEENIIENVEEDDDYAAGVVAFLKEMEKNGLVKKIDIPKEPSNITTKVEAIKDKEPKSQPPIVKKDNESSTETIKPNKPMVYGDMPLLNVCYKRPRVTWYETEFLIHINIHAPDVKVYHLEITEKRILFTAEIEGEQQQLLMNLLGTIKPETALHQIRGMKVSIRLVKGIYVKWPRLLQESDKHTWLTYDLDKIKERETSCYERQNIFRAITGFDEEEENLEDHDENSDSESEMFTNFTPITNKEDHYDPTQEV